MIALILAGVGNGCIFAGLTATVTRRLPAHQHVALYATGAGVNAVASILDSQPVLAVVNAALCAFWLHQWWHGGGGGDGTRRRLRRAFHGTRAARAGRTA